MEVEGGCHIVRLSALLSRYYEFMYPSICK